MKLSQKFRKRLKKRFLSALVLVTMCLVVLCVASKESNEIKFIRDAKATLLRLTGPVNSISDLKAEAKVVGGYNHFVALKNNGVVYTWGYNGYGQLGNGNTVNQLEPVECLDSNGSVITDAVDVAAGSNHTLILRKDGTVWVSGYNSNGQLGDGTTTNSNKFIQVKLNENGENLENIVAITAGENTSYALGLNGNVYGWGYNGYGQLGQNDTTASSYPVVVKNVSNIVKITAGNNNILMLDSLGALWAIGQNADGQFGLSNKSNYSLPVQLKDGSGNNIYGIKDMSSGSEHILIITSDGSVWASGYNSQGQLGNGTTSTKRVFTRVINSNGANVTNAKSVYAVGRSSYIITESSEIYSMGYNSNGQLFSKTTSNINKATKISVPSNAVVATMTKNYSYQTGAIVTTDGTIYTVGYNSYGQLGIYSQANSLTPGVMTYKKIKTDKNIIDLKVAGDTSKINYELTQKYNLTNDKISNASISFSSMDTSVATVSSNGVVTAVGIGTTYVKMYDTVNSIWKAVKVNVNGDQGITAPKVVAGDNYFVAL